MIGSLRRTQMPKGQQRSNREAKKPKQPKDKTAKALPLKGKTPILPPQR